jgi:hypothetical protein
MSTLKLIYLTNTSALVMEGCLICYSLHQAACGWVCVASEGQPAAPTATDLPSILSALGVSHEHLTMYEWHTNRLSQNSTPPAANTERDMFSLLSYATNNIGHNKLYLENIRAAADCSHEEAEALCEEAIKDGLLHKWISYQHPTEGFAVCNYPAEDEVSEFTWANHLAECAHLFESDDFDVPLSDARTVTLYAFTSPTTA